ncbi:MAG: hypothetical protein GX751_06035 [Desulfuromonadaceae bacterium]|nr:hypothetical protein [Desulfuromonadaceae bacterium]
MRIREEYEDIFKSELDEIMRQIKTLALTHRDEDTFRDLMDKEQKALLKLRELRASSKDVWGEIKTDLERSFDDLSRALAKF